MVADVVGTGRFRLAFAFAFTKLARPQCQRALTSRLQASQINKGGSARSATGRGRGSRQDPWYFHANGPGRLLATDRHYGPRTGSDVASFVDHYFLSGFTPTILMQRSGWPCVRKIRITD